jgi:hypothetical protein
VTTRKYKQLAKFIDAMQPNSTNVFATNNVTRRHMTFIHDHYHQHGEQCHIAARNLTADGISGIRIWKYQ